MSEEWTRWYPHHYTGCPVRPGQVFRILHKGVSDTRWQVSASITATSENCKDWNTLDTDVVAMGLQYKLGIIRYQLKKPKGVLLLESLLNKEPVV